MKLSYAESVMSHPWWFPGIGLRELLVRPHYRVRMRWSLRLKLRRSRLVQPAQVAALDGVTHADLMALSRLPYMDLLMLSSNDTDKTVVLDELSRALLAHPLADERVALELLSRWPRTPVTHAFATVNSRLLSPLVASLSTTWTGTTGELLETARGILAKSSA